MSLSKVKELILEPNELTDSSIESLFRVINTKKIDHSDIYFQNYAYESWALENNIIKEGSYGVDLGVGIRAVLGEQVAFSYSNDLSYKALENCTNIVRGISNVAGDLVVPSPVSRSYSSYYSPVCPINSEGSEDKILLMQFINDYVKSNDKHIDQVLVRLNSSFDSVLIYNHGQEPLADQRPLIRLGVTVIAKRDGKIESINDGMGGRYSFSELYANDYLVVKNMLDQMLFNLNEMFLAKSSPAGSMPVVLGAGWPGILLHEAVGHGLEGDFNRKKSSVFSDKMGQKIAASCCTVVDDGTIANRRGSLNFDDEGIPTQKTTLIENGKLVGYMQDRTNARLMGTSSTGNGRRESYAHVPMPRMTNTYMLNGEYAQEELIESISDGLFFKNFQGGQVDITSGKFVFSASLAYKIKNGKILYPVKGATLIGSGEQVLKGVTMLANDFSLDPGIGTCGKDGQSVPVGVGQPSMKISEITVGGTN